MKKIGKSIVAPTDPTCGKKMGGDSPKIGSKKK